MTVVGFYGKLKVCQKFFKGSNVYKIQSLITAEVTTAIWVSRLHKGLGLLHAGCKRLLNVKSLNMTGGGKGCQLNAGVLSLQRSH